MKTLILALLFSFGLKASKCVENKNFNCVKFLYTYDGDTPSFNIKGVHPLIGKKISVRVKGIDTPEIKAKSKCEKSLAKTAKKYVNHVLSRAKIIKIKNVERDKYFRILADIEFDGKSLSRSLLKLRLAYEYNGGKKTKINWCKFR